MNARTLPLLATIVIFIAAYALCTVEYPTMLSTRVVGNLLTVGLGPMITKKIYMKYRELLTYFMCIMIAVGRCQSSQSLSIPANAAPLVVGPRGVSVRRVEGEFRCQIRVSRRVEHGMVTPLCQVLCSANTPSWMTVCACYLVSDKCQIGVR